MSKIISSAVIRRMPRYYRYLADLMERGIERISSNELSHIMNVTASQIRQDLNNFGGFGQQGYGYNVKELHAEIGKILGLDNTHNVIIIGAGNLGKALAGYVQFEKRGFKITALFDNDPKIVGKSVRGFTVQSIDDLRDYAKENKVDIAAFTMPKEHALKMAELVPQLGIKAIWNFANTELDLPRDVIVENVHLSDSLMQLSYKILNGE